MCLAIRAFLREHHAPDGGFLLELIARECVNNAILHGNRLDERKSVDVTMTVGRRCFLLVVGDEGPGFDWRAAVTRPVPDDLAVGGRGLPIMGLYARRVRYNESGNRVSVWMARTQVEA